MGLLLFVPAVRGNIKLFKTVADNIVYRGRTNFVTSEGALCLFAAVKFLETGTDDFIDRG